MYFQPVVTLPGGKVSACEALGRGRFQDLPESPVELFALAEASGPEAQAELSRLFRRKAVELVKDRPEPPKLFVNTHYVELRAAGAARVARGAALVRAERRPRAGDPRAGARRDRLHHEAAQEAAGDQRRPRLRRLRGGAGAALRAGRGSARLPEVRPPLRDGPRERSRVARSGWSPRWWPPRASCASRRSPRASRRPRRPRLACGRASRSRRATTSRSRCRSSSCSRSSALKKPGTDAAAATPKTDIGLDSTVAERIIGMLENAPDTPPAGATRWRGSPGSRGPRSTRRSCSC